jgi:signal transduction histidine kinase
MGRRDQDLEAPGEMSALVRGFDWSQTPLGPIEAWPISLRTTVGIVLHSRQPMFLWWGPELIQIYNDAYRPSLGTGKHPTALGQRARDCWQEAWPIIGPEINDVMAHARPSRHEDELVPIYRNGRMEEVHWTYGYSPVFDDDGEIGGTLVVCIETTASVVANRRRRILREVTERTAPVTEPAELLTRAAEVLADHAGDVPFAVFYELDPASRATTSRRAVHLDERAARAIEELVRPHLDDLPAYLAVGELAGGVRLPGGPWPEPANAVFVTSIARPSDRATMVAVFGTSPRLGFDDDYRSFLLQLGDHLATARARIGAWRIRAIVEAERNNLLLQAPIATAVMTGPEHVFQLANPLYKKLVGRGDIVGKTYREAFPEVASTVLPGILDRVYQTGEPFMTNELRVAVVRDDRTTMDRYFRFNLEPMRDAAGKVYGMLAVAADVTDQVRARHTLEKTHAEREALLAELQAANRTKDEFLAMLGHELRNPLSPIVTALELMKLHDSGNAAHILLVERQVNHLIHLVDDLLDVARITRGHLELVREQVELSAVVARAIETASPLIERGGHVLAVDVPAQGLAVDADVTRLAQVIANLLTNAAKYTSPGGHIWVGAHVEDDQVVLEVRDDGVGIAPDMLGHIFGLFTQVPQDLARSQGGLGLGLSIVKALTEKHGGTVTAHSEGRGRGSAFTVRLPRASAAAVAASPTAPATTAEPGGPGGPGDQGDPGDPGGPAGSAGPGGSGVRRQRHPPRRVLLVDDNEDAAWILSETLSHIGHDVRCAHDGPSALRAALEHVPEVALIDIGLPVMDGYELAARLRAEPRLAGVRLIALTGYAQPGDRQRSSDAGFAAHLVKPVSISVLLEAIDAAP